MNILVTGSSGTIGTRLCERLLASKHDCRGVDWKPNKWVPAVHKITTSADLRDETALGTLPTKIDMIVHLAANARVYELVEHPDMARDNFLSTFNTLEFARKNSIRKIIFASSREAYGNVDADVLTEDMVQVNSCESPYTASKIGGEALVHAYQECYEIDSVIFRFSNVYGMYDDSQRVVPLFIRRAREGKTLTVFGREKCLDFTYIDDCVDGIMLAIEKFDAVKDDTYNIAFGEGNTLLRLAEKIKDLMQSSSEICVESSRTGEVIRYIADISKARVKLGYVPKVPFEEGVERAVAWYQEHSQ